MFEFPVVVYVPSGDTGMGPVDFPPSGNVMIMFTVDFGSPHADTVHASSRATWVGEMEHAGSDLPADAGATDITADAVAATRARAAIANTSKPAAGFLVTTYS
jgi:hypothetical protein